MIHCKDEAANNTSSVRSRASRGLNVGSASMMGCSSVFTRNRSLQPQTACSASCCIEVQIQRRQCTGDAGCQAFGGKVGYAFRAVITAGVLTRTIVCTRLRIAEGSNDQSCWTASGEQLCILHAAMGMLAAGLHVKVCSHRASMSSMSLYRPFCIAGTTCKHDVHVSQLRSGSCHCLLLSAWHPCCPRVADRT